MKWFSGLAIFALVALGVVVSPGFVDAQGRPAVDSARKARPKVERRGARRNRRPQRSARKPAKQGSHPDSDPLNRPIYDAVDRGHFLRERDWSVIVANRNDVKQDQVVKEGLKLALYNRSIKAHIAVEQNIVHNGNRDGVNLEWVSESAQKKRYLRFATSQPHCKLPQRAAEKRWGEVRIQIVKRAVRAARDDKVRYGDTIAIHFSDVAGACGGKKAKGGWLHYAYRENGINLRLGTKKRGEFIVDGGPVGSLLMTKAPFGLINTTENDHLIYCRRPGSVAINLKWLRDCRLVRDSGGMYRKDVRIDWVANPGLPSKAHRSGSAVNLWNRFHNRRLQYEGTGDSGGINLEWGELVGTDSKRKPPNIIFQSQQGGRLKYGQRVAMRVAGASKPWVVYDKDRKHGIKLNWSKEPRYEFELRGGPRGTPIWTGNPLGVWNAVARDHMLFCWRSGQPTSLRFFKDSGCKWGNPGTDYTEWYKREERGKRTVGFFKMSKGSYYIEAWSPSPDMPRAHLDIRWHGKSTNAHSSKRLLLAAGRQTAETVNRQQWSLERDGAYFRIVSKTQGTLLEATSDHRVALVARAKKDQQRWGLIPISHGYYAIVNKHSGRSLYVEPGKYGLVGLTPEFRSKFQLSKRSRLPAPGPPEKTMRVLTYNIYGLTRDAQNGKGARCDIRAMDLGRQIARAQPVYDLIGIQEYYYNTFLGNCAPNTCCPRWFWDGGSKWFEKTCETIKHCCKNRELMEDNCPRHRFNWCQKPDSKPFPYCGPHAFRSGANIDGVFLDKTNHDRFKPVGVERDGGIALLTPHRIEKRANRSWGELDAHAVFQFVNKSEEGVLFNRIRMKSGFEIDVYVVHIWSGPGNRDKRTAILEVLARDIHHNSVKRGKKNPVIVMGDFNMGGPPLKDPETGLVKGNPGYADILRILRQPRELWRETYPRRGDPTYMPSKNVVADKDGSDYRIDFILIPEDPYFTNSPYTIEIANGKVSSGGLPKVAMKNSGPQIQVKRFETLEKVPGHGMKLPVSDHYGLEATLEIRRRRE